MSSNNYFAKKNEYANKANKFLILGAASVLGIVGGLAAGPVLGAVSVPTLAISAVAGNISILGFSANKVAENLTSPYETKTIPERIMSSIKKIRTNSLGNATLSHEKKLN